MDDARYERFERQVAELNIDTAAKREIWLGRVGLVAAVLGPVIGIIAYVGSVSSADALGQRDMIVLGLLGVSVTIVGIGLFVRYSAVRFFRFWAARMVFELTAAVPHGGDEVGGSPTNVGNGAGATSTERLGS